MRGWRDRRNIWNLYLHLCWLENAVQSSPALVILSAVSKHIMKRQFLTFFIILILFSCSKVEKKDCIVNVVLFGTQGFCFKDSANWIIDSTKLDIRSYFEFKKDSFAIVSRGRLLKSAYSIINSTDTTGFYNLVQKVLLNSKFEKEYYAKGLDMYDGLYYTLYYKTSSKKEFHINYVPEYLPDSLRILHNYIQGIKPSNYPKNGKSFNLNSIIIEIAKEMYRNHPPPPPPSPVIENSKKGRN